MGTELTLNNNNWKVRNLDNYYLVRKINELVVSLVAVLPPSSDEEGRNLTDEGTNLNADLNVQTKNWRSLVKY